jgi:hypothetical protein
MTTLAQFALQKAAFDLFYNDAPLQNLDCSIYENPPAEVPFPYITFGITTTVDWSTKTSNGLQTAITLHVYSQKNKKEVMEILDRIFELLQSDMITLTGHNLVAMRFDYNEITLENYGVTYHGIIRFRAFTEEI